MIDLERLITERQDQLRGRPRDWIDDFGDRWRRIDWIDVAIITGALLVSALIVIAGVAVLFTDTDSIPGR